MVWKNGLAAHMEAGGGEGRQEKGCWSVFGCGGIKGGLAAHMEAGGGGGEGRQKKGCWSVFGCGGIKGGLAAHMEAGGGGERQKKGCWSVFGCEGGRIKGGLAADMTRRHKVGGGRGREYASARVSAGSVGNCGEEGRGPGGGGNQGR